MMGARAATHQALLLRRVGFLPTGAVSIVGRLPRRHGDAADQLGIGPRHAFRELKLYRDGPWHLFPVAGAWARVVEFITSI
jgi:hypothetical protein